MLTRTAYARKCTAVHPESKFTGGDMRGNSNQVLEYPVTRITYLEKFYVSNE